MTKKQIIVRRFSVTSSKSFQTVVSRLEGLVGHPDMSVFRRDVTSAKTYPEVEKIVSKEVGPSGFMEFTRFDHGEVVHKVGGAGVPRILRLVVGNPLIMKRMVEHVPDAGSYAPVMILTGSGFLSRYLERNQYSVARRGNQH